MPGCERLSICSQGASAIVPGDTKAYSAFMQTLPIESALAAAHGTGGGHSHSPHRHSSSADFAGSRGSRYSF